MSSLFERHPEQDLVRYIDGELSARRAAKIASHLESCGPCRAELEAYKNSLAECARYQQELEAQTPSAPAPWRDLYRDFSRIDESLAHTSLLGRLTRSLGHSGAPRWALVTGLAVLIALFSLNQLRQTPSVEAASLLRKAVAASESKPRATYRIRVRTSRQQEFTRLAGAQAAVLQVAEAQVVARLFAAAHYDWQDPLSARAFEQWRDAQPNKSDEVTTTESDHLTRIRTVSADGELQAASLTLQTDGYLPVEERLEFRDGEWVELNEIAETSTVSGGGSVATHVEVPVRAAEPPSRPAAFAPGPSASISDELQVLSALSGIGADLGDPVEVSLSDGKVLVTGEGIPLRRQEQIRATLANLPNVAVNFAAPDSAAVPAGGAVTMGSTTPNASPLQARLEKQLGGHAEFDRFSTQVLDLDEAAMPRVYALHRLAQKFPAAEEGQLSSQDLNVLHELSRKHVAVLAEKVAGMEKTLAPALASLGGTANIAAPAAHGNWQPAVEAVYSSALSVDVLMSQLFGMTPAKASSNTVPSDLLAALKELQADLGDCQKLLESR